MNKFNQALLDSKQKVVGAVATGAAVLSTGSFAAVDAAVTTALADGKADVLVIGAAVLLIFVAVAGFKYLKKPL